MATALPVQIQMGALPPNIKVTPQQLADLMVARMSLVSEQEFSLFASGTTEPASNVGPWLKTTDSGGEWYVWSNDTGDYVPISVPAQSLGYVVSATEPDPATTFFWIQLDGLGSPLALKTYYSGAWVDVYASQLTLKAPLASPAFTGTPTAPTPTYPDNTTKVATTAYVTAAIAAIPSPGAFQSYPADATNTVAQSIPTDGTPTKVTMGSALVNPDGSFNTGTSRYTAAATGVYSFACSSVFNNDTGNAATMRVALRIYVNGVDTGIGDQDNTPSPNDSEWSPSFGGILGSLNNGDYVEVFAVANDGGSAAIDLTTIHFSCFRVK